MRTPPHPPRPTHLVAADCHVGLVRRIHLVAKLCLEVRAGAPESRAEGVLRAAAAAAAVDRDTHSTPTAASQGTAGNNVLTAARQVQAGSFPDMLFSLNTQALSRSM